jgi:hypothetical protein
MKRTIPPGTTSVILDVFIQDSSQTDGRGLTGLVHNSGSLTAYYHRDSASAAVAISLVTMTVGTFTSGGFKEISSTNLPGFYQICVPDAAFASGAKSVSVMLKGATNMAPCVFEVQLTTAV